MNMRKKIEKRIEMGEGWNENKNELEKSEDRRREEGKLEDNWEIIEKKRMRELKKKIGKMMNKEEEKRKILKIGEILIKSKNEGEGDSMKKIVGIIKKLRDKIIGGKSEDIVMKKEWEKIDIVNISIEGNVN